MSAIRKREIRTARKTAGRKYSIENMLTDDTGEILKEIKAQMNVDDSEITVDHDQDDYDDINMLEDEGQILDQGQDYFSHVHCS